MFCVPFGLSWFQTNPEGSVYNKNDSTSEAFAVSGLALARARESPRLPLSRANRLLCTHEVTTVLYFFYVSTRIYDNRTVAGETNP